MDDLRPTIRSVQRLAHALGVEAHGAEDMAQEAWLTALRKGVGGAGLQRWLAGALRRIARASRRDEARRRERETRAASAGVENDATSSAMRIEIAGRLVHAVEGLEEPQRTAIVLRFFEDLPPRAIAERLGIPVNTARSRVRRGLETLRSRLDRASLAAIVSLSLEARRGAARSGAWTSVGLAAGGAAVLFGGLRLSGALSGLERGAESTDLAANAPVLEGPTLETTARGALDQRVERERAVLSPQVSDPGSARGSSEGPSSGLEAEVVGRFVHPDGHPVAGLRVLLDPSLVYMDRLPLESGGPHPDDALTEPLLVTTDAQGRFRIRFRPASHIGYQILIEEPLDRTWRLPWIPVGEAFDLGEIALARGGLILGRLVDSEGSPVLGPGWELRVASRDPASVDSGTGGSGGELSDEVSTMVSLHPASGAFRVERLPPGHYQLTLKNPLTSWIDGPSLELHGAEAAVADVVYDGPALERRIRLDLRGNATSHLSPESSRIHLSRGEGEVLHPERLADTPLSLVFDALAPSDYALTIDDPRFLSWRQEGVRPGSVVVAELQGSAALRLEVRERATGTRLERFSVRARLLVPRQTHSERLLHRGDGPLADGLLAGVVPGSYSLAIRADGFGPETVEVLELAPGETRALRLTLGPGEWAAGRVRDAAGEPVGQAALTLFPAAARLTQGAGRPLLAASSAEDGAFRIQLPGAGSYWLAAASKNPEALVGVSFSIAEDESAEGLELVLPTNPSR